MIKLSEAVEKYKDYEVDESKLESILVKPKIGVKWITKLGEKYYYINVHYEPLWAIWCNDNIDNFRCEMNLAFETYEECEKAIEIRKAFKEASFLPDWKDKEQRKYYIYYDYHNNKFHVGHEIGYNRNSPYCFESKEISQQLLDRFSEEDILKYIFNVYE